MISTLDQPYSRLWTAIVVAAVLVASGCGGDDSQTVDPSQRLCQGEAGVGARIGGAPAPMDFCAPNNAVSAELGALQPGRYDVIASFTEGGLTVELEISFYAESGLPKVLNFTPDPSLGNPGDVWLFYRESQPQQPDLSSLSVSGIFTLTFADASVVAATFNSVTIQLETDTGQRAGTRTISEGFLNLTIDN